MTDLARLQRAFQRHVYLPARTMEREVLTTPRASAARRLAIYANAYRSRLVEALGIDYPALQVVLGEDKFNRLTLEFIAAQPSRCANLRWYGDGLARFLVRSPRWQKRPLLSELAAFEWALGLAFDAANAPELEAEAIARLPAHDWPGMRLRLHPAVLQLKLRSNAPAIWHAATAKKKLPRSHWRRAPAVWLVWRKTLLTQYRLLDTDEAWALQFVERGRTFGALCTGLQRFAGKAHAPLRAAQLLRNWLSEGLLCRVEIR